LKLLAEREAGYLMCRSKLAEVLEKILKAELIRTGWFLEKTHDLERLYAELVSRSPELARQADTLCDALAEAYFSDRYPGFDFEDPNWPKLKDQLLRVEALLNAVKVRLPR
jgi:HEPN domain-containing protein